MENAPSSPNPNQAPNPNMLAQQIAANRARTPEEQLDEGREQLSNNLLAIVESANHNRDNPTEAIADYLSDVLADTAGRVPATERMAVANFLFNEQRNTHNLEFIHNMNAANAQFRHGNVNMSRRFADLLLPIDRRAEELVNANDEVLQEFRSIPPTDDGLRNAFPVKQLTREARKVISRKDLREHLANPKPVIGSGDRSGLILANRIDGLAIGVKESGFKGYVNQWVSKHKDTLRQLELEYESYENRDFDLKHYEATADPSNPRSRDLSSFITTDVLTSVANKIQRALKSNEERDEPKSPAEALNPLFETAARRDMSDQIRQMVDNAHIYVRNAEAQAGVINQDVDDIISEIESMMEGYSDLRSQATSHGSLLNFMTGKQYALQRGTSQIHRAVYDIKSRLDKVDDDREKRIYHDKNAGKGQSRR